MNRVNITATTCQYVSTVSTVVELRAQLQALRLIFIVEFSGFSAFFQFYGHFFLMRCTHPFLITMRL